MASPRDDDGREATCSPPLPDHSLTGLVSRTRWEHGIAASPPLPTRWVYSETRAVVILDLRRGDLVWSQKANHVIDFVLSSLCAGPQDGATVDGSPLLVHVTVALSAREGWPLRILVQGYRLRCGARDDGLCSLMHEQLSLALGEREEAPGWWKQVRRQLVAARRMHSERRGSGVALVL